MTEQSPQDAPAPPGVLHNAHTDTMFLASEEAASADVLAVRTVVRDGWYNMPTDLTRWGGYYWLSYRRSTGHSCVGGNSVNVTRAGTDTINSVVGPHALSAAVGKRFFTDGVSNWSAI